MGYETRYELSWEIHSEYKGDSDELTKKIATYIKENDLYGLESDGSCAQSVKWYEAKEDIKNMSEKIKNVLFHLGGEGEESGDIWDFFALNGKTQYHEAMILRGTVDPKKWEK